MANAMRNRTLAITAFLLLTMTACGSEDATPTSADRGTVFGTITIGPLCPVEPCTPTAAPYEGLEIVLRNEDGAEAARIPVNSTGTFSGSAPVGNYVAMPDPCEWLGCSSSGELPVTVVANQDAEINFDIDTGIR